MDSRTNSTAPASGNVTFIIRNLYTTLLVAASALILATFLFTTSGAGSDRSGFGMVVIGMTFMGLPVLATTSALSFILRRTIFGDIAGGISFFLVLFMGGLYMLGAH